MKAKPMESHAEPFSCEQCLKEVILKRVTNANPDSPEVFQLPPGGWVGQIQDDVPDEEGELEVVLFVLCSDKCRDAFFAEYSEEAQETSEEAEEEPS